MITVPFGSSIITYESCNYFELVLLGELFSTLYNKLRTQIFQANRAEQKSYLGFKHFNRKLFPSTIALDKRTIDARDSQIRKIYYLRHTINYTLKIQTALQINIKLNTFVSQPPVLTL